MNSENMKATLQYPVGQLLGTESKTGPNPMKALFSDVGNIQKSSDKLMFALIKCRFPGQFDEQQAMDGHPTMFMKILHYVLFYSSEAVRNYLYSKEIDPLTIHLNDYKFMERIFFILVSPTSSIFKFLYFEQTNLLGLKPRISIQ